MILVMHTDILLSVLMIFTRLVKQFVLMAVKWLAKPGPVKGGTTVIAFVEDPDGYKIEFIENKSAKSALGN